MIMMNLITLLHRRVGLLILYLCLVVMEILPDRFSYSRPGLHTYYRYSRQGLHTGINLHFIIDCIICYIICYIIMEICDKVVLNYGLHQVF